MTNEDIIKSVKCYTNDVTGIITIHKDQFTEALTTYRAQVLEEERKFILNVLDGIDLADEQMGNKGGGTKAIRFALQSRIIHPTN
jgi:hypothetical protein